MNKSYYTIFTILVVGLLASCNSPTEPTDLSGYKSLLGTKKAELNTLKAEIAEIEAQVEKLSPKKEKKTSLVTLKTVQKETMDRYASLQASVMSDELVNASSEIGGRLTSVTVNEGDYVKRGQLIATVDTDIMDKQVDELQTGLNLAIIVFEKQKRLWDQNIGSEIQFLQAKNNKEALEKSLQTMQAQLAKKNVYSPVSGVIDMEFLNSGEMASPGMPIVNILNTSKLKIVADVPENYLTKVKRGDKVNITIPAIDKEITRRITLIGRSIDPSNRTFKIEMSTDNLRGLLKPNLLSEVKINDLTLTDAITVPIELIQQEVDGKEYVYVAEAKGDKLIATKKYVEKGEAIGNVIEVTKGLGEGEKLVVLGARTVTEGDYLVDENAK